MSCGTLEKIESQIATCPITLDYTGIPTDFATCHSGELRSISELDSCRNLLQLHPQSSSRLYHVTDLFCMRIGLIELGIMLYLSEPKVNWNNTVKRYDQYTVQTRICKWR